MHAKATCVKRMWSTLGTKPTKPPLADKGGICCRLCFPSQKNSVKERLINIDDSLDWALKSFMPFSGVSKTGHYFALQFSVS
jgi:hypothetical protein